MRIVKMPIDQLIPSKYNPRKDLKPGDPEYEKLRKSILEFNLVEPFVWNERTKHLVGGHQRLKILQELGYTEVEVSVVDLPENKEKALNVALNKIQGDWDYEKLAQVLDEIMQSLGEEGVNLAGFDNKELDQLKNLLMDMEKSVAEETMVTDEEIEELKTQYKRIPWDKFRVFHAVVGDQLYCMDGFNYLVSYGTFEGVFPDRSKPPHSLLFVDSGLLTGARKVGRKFLDMQDEVIGFAIDAQADWVAMMDVPMIEDVLGPLELTPKEAYEIHLRNARRFAEIKIPIRKVFVVQGSGLSDFKACCKDMRGLIKPEDVVAIGSIKNRAADIEYITLVTSLVKEHFPQNDIHLFGVSTPKTVAYARLYGASSCDSASANLAGGLGGLLICKREQDGYSSKKISLHELMGEEDLSIGGKLWVAVAAYNMAIAETTILAAGEKLERALFGLNAAMEEAAICLETERIENEQGEVAN